MCYIHMYILILHICCRDILAFITQEEHQSLAHTELRPTYIESFVGDTVELVCSLPDSKLNFVNSNCIYFRHIIQGTKLDYTSQPFVQVISNSSAVLTLTMVSLDPIQYIECLCDNETAYPAYPPYSRISVFQRPIEPVVLNCTILDWSNVECTVGPSREAQMKQIGITNRRHIEYTISWHIRDLYKLNPVLWRTECSEDDVVVCRWNRDFADDHHHHLCTQASAVVRLSGRNLTILSAIKCFKVSSIVKLSPPRNLSLRSDDKQHILIIPLRFEHPVQIVFLANYVSLHHSGAVSVNVNSQRERFALITFRAQPYTEYVVLVQCRIEDSLIWSGITSYNFTQPSSDVCAQPQVDQSGFDVIKHTEHDVPRVKVYWKRISSSDRCGPGLLYRLTCRVMDTSQIGSTCQPCGETNSDQSSYDLSLTDRPQHVIVTAVNDLTDKQNLQQAVCSCSTCQTIIVPSTSDAHKHLKQIELVAEGIQRTVQLTWIEEFTGLTIYWCERNGTSSTCSGNLNWTRIDALTNPAAKRNRSLRMELEKRFDSYVYGWSADSTGIQWIECIYAVHGIVSVPNMTVVTESGSPHSVIITWKSAQCVYGVRGYTALYIVQYCLSDAGSRCTDVRYNLTFNSSSQVFHNHILPTLRDGRYYTFWLMGVSSSGKLYGPSNRVTVKTKAIVFTGGLISGIVVIAIFCCIIIACGLCCGISSLRSKVAIAIPAVFSIFSEVPKPKGYSCYSPFSQSGTEDCSATSSARCTGHIDEEEDVTCAQDSSLRRDDDGDDYEDFTSDTRSLMKLGESAECTGHIDEEEDVTCAHHLTETVSHSTLIRQQDPSLRREDDDDNNEDHTTDTRSFIKLDELILSDRLQISAISLQPNTGANSILPRTNSMHTSMHTLPDCKSIPSLNNEHLTRKDSRAVGSTISLDIYSPSQENEDNCEDSQEWTNQQDLSGSDCELQPDIIPDCKLIPKSKQVNLSNSSIYKKAVCPSASSGESLERSSSSQLLEKINPHEDGLHASLKLSPLTSESSSNQSTQLPQLSDDKLSSQALVEPAKNSRQTLLACSAVEPYSAATNFKLQIPGNIKLPGQSFINDFKSEGKLLPDVNSE